MIDLQAQFEEMIVHVNDHEAREDLLAEFASALSAMEDVVRKVKEIVE